MKTIETTFLCLILFAFNLFIANANTMHNSSDKGNSFKPGNTWLDNNGVHINAHGGGILFYDNKYYWFGEHRPERGYTTSVGVMCYSSDDLYNWKDEGVAFSVVDDNASSVQKGCIIERPKVIYNAKTKKFVMYFHHELKGKGYAAAYVGVAVSDNVAGPYKLLKTGRVNPGKWPLGMTEEQKSSKIKEKDLESWTPKWRDAVDNGLLTRRDYRSGQMSRDMTLFVDDDGKAYHIYSSEENLTLQLAELTDDYLDYTGKYIRIHPGGHNEAPAVLKKDGRYFMITSGCTGWDPNPARLLVADNIWGPWELNPNPCVGEGSGLTFRSQSTYILPVNGKKDAFIFMADRWKPRSLMQSSYIWLPVLFEKGMPVLKWMDEWDLGIFDQVNTDWSKPKEYPGWNLVWNDEFDYTGRPDADVWSFEKGFIRNKELQWYQEDNAVCKDGLLVITGRKEQVKNPRYKENDGDWRRNREYAEYTSSLVKTDHTKEFQYGRFEIRAKLPVTTGSWPAIWTLGTTMEWPSNGEIDLLELYLVDGKPHLLANTAWGSEKRYDAKWNSSIMPFSKFLEEDPFWVDKFHVWRMDWDEDAIRLYIDDVMVNETLLKDTNNGSLGDYKNPFRQPHYILLNLAIGGNGGAPDETAFPLVYEVDYVRVYQKK